ncbi:hypothetical protein S83_047026, partial [Arachis hypogaea]
KFYLADAGYMLRSGFITPYRSTRYYLREYSRHPPENPKELFNLRHSSLRNAIERAFGVLKNRFPILSEMSRYNVDTIIIACCILHNFLMDFDPDEEIIAQVDRDLMNNVPEDRASRENIARGEDGRRGEILRDTIAAEMWNDYIRCDMDSEKVSDVEGKNECDTYFKWTMEMDGLMLEVLKEQKNKGQKEDRAFSAESYRKVVEEINEKFSVGINKSKVLNRLKTLKKQMVLAKEINQKSGVGWNDTTKTFEATPDANPKFKAIRGKHLYHLKILKKIYDKDIANGMRVETGKQKVRRWEKEDTHVNIDDIDEMQANNEVHLENFNPFDYESMPASPTSQAPPSSIPSVSNTSSAKGCELLEHQERAGPHMPDRGRHDQRGRLPRKFVRPSTSRMTSLRRKRRKFVGKTNGHLNDLLSFLTSSFNIDLCLCFCFACQRSAMCIDPMLM